MNLDAVIGRFSVLDDRFDAAVKKLAGDWAPERAPATMVMAEFGKVLAEATQLKDFRLLASGLALVEECMKDDQVVRDAVATGLLESLLTESSAQRVDFNLVARHLGERSKVFCREWDAFTGVKTPGL